MLARMRSFFLLSFLWAFSVAACLPVQAQIHGVPASVTSFGFGGSDNPTPGVRASMTYLGTNGYGNSRPVFGNCCANFFMPASPNPTLFSGRRHRHGDHAFFPVGVSMPAYIHMRFLTSRKPTMTHSTSTTSTLLARGTQILPPNAPPTAIRLRKLTLPTRQKSPWPLSPRPCSFSKTATSPTCSTTPSWAIRSLTSARAAPTRFSSPTSISQLPAKPTMTVA